METSKTDSCIIVGAGCAGAACGRTLADKGWTNIRIYERRSGIGGNAYDCSDEYGVLIHPYGPHIFHTNQQAAYDFISRFTKLNGYQHKVVAKVNNLEIPVPFNLHSLALAFPQQYGQMKEALEKRFGAGSRVTIIQLRQADEPLLQTVADYVYENVFRHYTAKQWGSEEVDPAVISRVPVLLSEDDRYFQDSWQGLPDKGYTVMFAGMLDHSDIQIDHSEALQHIKLADGRIYADGSLFTGPVIYTGAVDELFDYVYGPLPYRTLDIVMKHYPQDQVQSHGTVNYTVDQHYTRITEFKQMTLQKISGTTTATEYSKAYSRDCGTDPYYPIACPQSAQLYQRYLALAESYPNLHLVGRLAEYRYYNMDAALLQGIKTAEKIIGEKH